MLILQTPMYMPEDSYVAVSGDDSKILHMFRQKISNMEDQVEILISSLFLLQTQRYTQAADAVEPASLGLTTEVIHHITHTLLQKWPVKEQGLRQTVRSSKRVNSSYLHSKTSTTHLGLKRTFGCRGHTYNSFWSI
jgi:hypothetical protein